MSESPHERLDAWIDRHFDEQVRFLQELVRVPTDTPPGDNAPHAERTAGLLAATRLLVALESRGHTRLPLDGGARAALAEAGLEAAPWAHDLPADADAARAAWAGSPLVAIEPAADAATPLAASTTW